MPGIILSSGSCQSTIECDGATETATLTVDPALGTWDAAQGKCVINPSALGITVSPTTYSATLPNATANATYTLQNGTSADTNCRLLDNTGTPLTAYSFAACSGTFALTTALLPQSAGTYSYSIQANQGSTGQTATSNAFTVTVTNAASATTCGTANNVQASSPPASNLCASGATLAYGVNWRCEDSDGATGNCDTSYQIPSDNGSGIFTQNPQYLWGCRQSGVTTGCVAPYVATNNPLVCANGAIDPPTCTPPTTATVRLDASALSVNAGQPITLTWSSSHVSSCAAVGGAFATSGATANSTGVSVTPTTTGHDYQLNCVSSIDGSNVPSNVVSVTVSSGAPTISATPNRVNPNVPGGGTTTISWTTGVNGCTVAGPHLSSTSAPKPSGSVQVSGITSQSTYTITCGAAHQSAVVNVTAGFVEF